MPRENGPESPQVSFLSGWKRAAQEGEMDSELIRHLREAGATDQEIEALRHAPKLADFSDGVRKILGKEPVPRGASAFITPQAPGSENS